MKVGILSESDADEAGIRILAEAVLGFSLEIIQPIRVRARGWTAVRKNLPSVYKSLHFNPEADGLIVVMDSDDTPVHDRTHDANGFIEPDCRLCEMHRVIVHLRNSVPGNTRLPLRIAIGLAVPAIEAWYQCGRDIHSTEARFAREPAGKLYELRRELKRKTYGMVSAPHELLKSSAIEHTTRVGRQIHLLEQNFPNGFGSLARSLRIWVTGQSTL